MPSLSEQVAALEAGAADEMRQRDQYREWWVGAEAQLRKALDRVGAAERALATAKVEGAREALTHIHKAIAFDPITVNQIRAFRDREYPAPSASAEPVTPPSVPEPLTMHGLRVIAAFISPVNSSRWQGGLVNVTEDGAWWGYADAAGEWSLIVSGLPADARRIVAMAATEGR